MDTILPDKGFMEAFRQGDCEAFSYLYREHHEALTFYSQQLINNKQLAEEIVSDNFIKLLVKREDFECAEDIRTFLYVSTRNACYDYLRCKEYTIVEQQPSRRATVDAASKREKEPDLVKKRLLQAIYKEIEHLPAQCKKVFKHIFFNGLSTEETALAMEISSQVVLEQKNRALTLLRLSLLKPGTLAQQMK